MFFEGWFKRLIKKFPNESNVLIILKVFPLSVRIQSVPNVLNCNVQFLKTGEIMWMPGRSQLLHDPNSNRILTFLI